MNVCFIGPENEFCLSSLVVPVGLLSRGGNVPVYVLDITKPSLPTLSILFFVSVSVFMAISTVFYSMNFPDNSPLSHVFLWSYFCLLGPFNCISLCESLPQP